MRSTGLSERGLALVAGLSSGLLYCASIPKVDLFFLAWLALIPLFLALPRLPPSLYVPTGLLAGLVAATGRTYWISETLQLYGHLPPVLAHLTTALLIAYIALYSAVFLALCTKLDFTSPFFAWAAAAIWTLLEWVQNWMLSGFPWQLLGYSQYLNLPFVQFSSISGIYGLSFVLVLFNAGLAQALHFRRPWPYLALPLLLTGLIHLWGYQRLQALDQEETPTIDIGVVQGNISQDRKWNVNRLQWTTQHYVDLSRRLVAANSAPPDLIIFPETALPYYFNEPFYKNYRQPIEQLAQDLQIPLLVGSLQGSLGGEKPVYNRAFLLDTQGQVSAYADKVHLVPFGEFLPFPSIFQYLEGLTAESGEFTHGTAHRTISLPSREVELGVFICYESIFPEIARELAQQGVDFLVNTTNDAWFGHTAAPYQHFAMSVVRAVETGRAVVRAANTGISGVIAPNGRIEYATELFATTTFIHPVPLRREQTFYTRYGNLLLIACALLLSVHLYSLYRKRARA